MKLKTDAPPPEFKPTQLAARRSIVELCSLAIDSCLRRIESTSWRESVILYPALERIDVDRSLDQVRDAPPLRSIPLGVLSADRPWGPQIPSMIAAGKLPSDVPPDFGYVTDAAQKKAQEQLANLVPNAKHIANTNSVHEIHKEQPQHVIDAIRQVVEAVRSDDRQLARRIRPLRQ